MRVSLALIDIIPTVGNKTKTKHEVKVTTESGLFFAAALRPTYSYLAHIDRSCKALSEYCVQYARE